MHRGAVKNLLIQWMAAIYRYYLVLHLPSLSHVIRHPYPNTSKEVVLWFSFILDMTGSEGLPSHPQVCQRAHMWTSQYYSSFLSFPVCLMGQRCWAHGSCWETEKEIRRGINRDFECYTKVPQCFFLSHGEHWQLTGRFWMHRVTCLNLEMLVRHLSVLLRCTERKGPAWRHRFKKYLNCRVFEVLRVNYAWSYTCRN